MAAVNGPGEWTYGIQLPIQTLTRTLADPWEDSATVDDLVAIAKRCDDAGYGFVGVCDHVAIPDNDYAARMTTTWYDTVATLGFLASATTRTRLLSSVWIAAYRHPLQTAKSFGTLAHLSNGRIVLGVGAGHLEAEFDALGLDFSSRGRQLDETLDALRGVFTDTYVSHSGPRFSYTDMGVSPQPPDEIPIWVGGSGRAAWLRTGSRGDGWIPMGNPKDQYPEAIDTICSAAAEAGRPDASFDIGYMTPWAYILGDRPDDLPPAMYTGSPEGFAGEIRAARAVGANTFHLKFRGRDLQEYSDQIDAFAEEVVPLVDEP